jgi:hypothetical protein
VDKVMSSTRLVFKKNSSKAVSDLLRQSILEIVANPVMDQGAHKWVICSFMVEMFIKYTEDMVKELVLKDLLGPSYHGEVKYLQFLTNLKEERSASQVLDVSIQSSSLPSMLSLADILLSSSISSSPSGMLPTAPTTFTRMGLTKMTDPTTAFVATRLLTSISTWLLSIMKSTSPSPQLVSLSSMLATDHSRCFSLLPSSAAAIEGSCRSCQAWSQLEQQRSGSLRPRLKLLAEVLLKMGQFKECLRMFSNSLLVMLRHEADAVQAD